MKSVRLAFIVSVAALFSFPIFSVLLPNKGQSKAEQPVIGESEPLVSSYFPGADTEGWSMYLSSMANPGTGGLGGGDNNGFLKASPPTDGRTAYYVAPDKFHGDWRNYQELKLALWSSGGTYYTSGYYIYGDIFLANSTKTAQLLLPRRPADTWDLFTVTFDNPAEWTLGGGAATLDEVLSNITDFQIRAEYGIGTDYSGLDNVELFGELSEPNIAFCSAKGGWYAEIFNNRDLLGVPQLTRCEKEIDYYWGEAGPEGSLLKDNFSIRWTRNIEFPSTGWYRFRTFTDDGLRLYIDGDELINDWSARAFDEMSVLANIGQGLHRITMEYAEWSGDALAYLNWYLCPGGLSDCSVSVSLDYQTRYLDSPMPETCTDEANQTIARWGCLITSISMALEKYGIYTTPAELNHWLSGEDPDTNEIPRGYQDTCDGSLVWDAILKFAKEKGKDLKWQGTNDAASVIREQKLPVIMQVAGGGHYVLATDVIEQGNATSFGINDPHHAWACQAVAASPALPPESILQCNSGALKHATTVQEENLYKGSTIPLKYLKEQSEARTSSLQLFADGVEMIITDAQGRQVGYDQTTGNVLTDIPNSFYFDDSIVPPGENPPDIVERVLYLPEFAGGIYSLQLTRRNSSTLSPAGLSLVSYKVEAIGFNSEFTMVKTAISGLLADGQTAEYQITYDPGQDIQITDTSNNKIFIPLVNR